MDWINLLRSQQKDFLRRVKQIESREVVFLDAGVSGCHSERVNFSESQLIQLLDIAREKALQITVNYPQAYFTKNISPQNISPQNISPKSLSPQQLQNQLERYFYYEQLSEKLLNLYFFQIFQSFDDGLNNIFDANIPPKNISPLYKFSYQLIGNPRFSLQINICTDSDRKDLNHQKISWQINQDDIKNHHILLFATSQPHHPQHREQNITLWGFLPTQLISISPPHHHLEPSQLLYSGGLTWTVEWLKQHQLTRESDKKSNYACGNTVITHTDSFNKSLDKPLVNSNSLTNRNHLQSLVGEWECWQTLTGHKRGINCLAYTPENLLYQTPALLATGSKGEIKLWNLTRGELICTLSEHQWSRSGWVDEVNCLTFSQDGRLLVSGSGDSTIKIWHVGARDLVDILQEHQRTIRCIGLTPNQRTLVTAGDDRTILFWDLRRREIESRLSVMGAGIHALAFNNQGDKFIIGCDRQIQVWDTDLTQTWQQLDFEPQQKINAHGHIVRVLAISNDGEYLVSGSRDQTIKIWRLATGELVRTLTGHQDSIHAIAISPIQTQRQPTITGHLIASGSADRTIRLWHLETGEHLATFRGHTHTITALTFTISGEIIVSTSLDKTIKIWQRND